MRVENNKSSTYDVNSPAQCHLHFLIGRNGADSGEGEPNEISTVITSYQNNVTPAGSTSTMVYDAVISLEILLISEQDDAALWRMFASALLP